MSEPALALDDVDKAYPYFRLSGLRLRLEPGQIMGFVGPNGAGKSTTIRILMGMLRADRGEVRVLGRSMPRDEAAAKQEIGFVSEDMRLHPHATLAWHMQFVRAAFGRWDEPYAQQLLQRFTLHPARTIAHLSHGERLKATLLLALARRPRLLLLDEPTAGLDPVARHEVLAELMDVVRDERRAVLFSSHNTQDVEQISDWITFLDRGRIIDARDKESFLDRWRRLHLDAPPDLPLPNSPGVVQVQTNGRITVVTLNDYDERSAQRYVQAGAALLDEQRMTLEEIFVATVLASRREQAA